MQSKTGKSLKHRLERRNRVAELLRANLRRRKEQLRARVDAQDILSTLPTMSDPSKTTPRKSSC